VSVEYANVKNAHIVPRSYLERFSLDGRLAVHINDPPGVHILRVESVGTRRRYYRRVRPDGTEIDDIEWSLSQIEERAAPLLARFTDVWPAIALEEKLAVAQLFAFQLLRVPLWMDFYASNTREHFAEYRTTDEGRKIGTATIDAVEAHLLASTTRLTHMLQMGMKLAPVLASMHWTLVEFRRPLLATSDQPIVVWPIDAWSRAPAKTPPTVGVIPTIEIRAPITPSQLILMTWADLADREAARCLGRRHHAGSINAFTIAQSDRQWFHQPGANPPCSSGSLCPVAPELVPGYNAVAAHASGRRARASEIMQPMIGKPMIDKAVVEQQMYPVEVVTIT
jgi:Protein of unknown function (DUF4238)